MRWLRRLFGASDESGSLESSSPFRHGQEYRVVKVPPFYQGKIVVGTVVKYNRTCFSPYDECIVYLFVDKAGEEFEWWLYDEEPLDSWEKYFAVANSAG